MGAQRWLAPHPDMAMTTIGRTLYRVLRTDKGWKIRKSGPGSPEITLAADYPSKLDAQNAAVEDYESHLKRCPCGQFALVDVPTAHDC